MENVKTLQSSKVILVQSWNYISHWMGGNKEFVNPLTPMSDQDRISPYNINTISSRQMMRMNKKINQEIVIDPTPNSPNKVTRIVWQA